VPSTKNYRRLHDQVVSRPGALENGGDVKLSTLRNYIQGLGGELSILAVFGESDDTTAVPLRIGSDDT